MARKKRLKVAPTYLNLEPLKPYIEADCEIEKETLIERIAGKIDRSFLNMVRLLQFHSITKTHNGDLFIL